MTNIKTKHAMFTIAAFSFVTLLVVGNLQGQSSEEEELAKIARVIGPEGADNSCVTCHALENEAWEQTTHFATFAVRHTTDEAKEILSKMGERSMKRSENCRQCHYTSVLSNNRVRANWGVSCESCHNGAESWNAVHNVVNGQAMEWGTGKNQSAEDLATRLNAAKEKGMIHSGMLYDIALNCFGCHTVPNEVLVNKGGHLAGSDFDLTVWSQGEVRHNFASSAGAPGEPKNRPATQDQLRRMHVVGAVADLATTLRNLANVSEKGGAYHKAMVDRANAAAGKIQKILDAVELEVLKTAMQKVPTPVASDSQVTAAMADALDQAGRAVVDAYDGTSLGALDAMIPAERKGEVFRP